MIYISDVELAGSIPGMVKTQAGKKQGEVASRIEEAMKKEWLIIKKHKIKASWFNSPV